MKYIKTTIWLTSAKFFLSSVFLIASLSGIVLIESGCNGCNWPNTTNTTPNNNNSAPSGFDGAVHYCNSSANGTAAIGTLHIEANLKTALPGATGDTTMKEDIKVSFPANGNFASAAGFRTQLIYKQGTWNITKVQIIGLTGLLPGVSMTAPLTVTLPGNPVFDFTGGACKVQ